MVENLKDQRKKVVFWNWESYNARSLVVRYNTEYKNLFKFSSDINEIFYEFKLAESNSSVVET